MAKHSSLTVKVVLLSLQGLLMLFYLGDARAQSSSGSDLYTTRKVSISYQRAYLDEVLQQLSEQAGVYFVYSGHVLEPRVPVVSITANQQPIWHVLQMLGQQLHLTFRAEGKYIIVKKPAVVKTVAVVPTRRATSAPAATPDEIPAPTAPVREEPLTLLTSVRSNALYSSLTRHQQPALLSVADGITQRRSAGWFVSGGIFANDITYGGLEIQGGLRRAFIVVNAGLLEGSRYRIGYGAGTSLSLDRRWDLQLTYTFARMREEDNIKLAGHSWHGAVIRDNSLRIRLRHQQVKAMLHYRLTPRVDLLFGPTLNLIHARYTQRTVTEPMTGRRSFFVSARDEGRPLFSKETAPFVPGNKPEIGYAQVLPALYTEDSFSARQVRLGFEAGVSYRINFSGH